MTLVRGENGLLTDTEYNFGFGMMRANETLFFEKDHLGSVRSVVNDLGEVVATNDYYPFGVRHMGGLRDDNIRYKFNGMEEQTTGGLNLLDYGARMYDNELGRWFVQDPLAEKYYSLSTYDFVGGNPINRVDPNGMDWYELSNDDDENKHKQNKPKYMYTTEYRSQADLDKAGIKGTYIGLTDKKGGKYLSLMGDMFDLKNADGSNNHYAKMAENFDNAIENYYKIDVRHGKYGISEEIIHTQDMTIPGLSTKKNSALNSYYFSYAGGRVKYNISDDLRGGMIEWGTGAYAKLGYMTGQKGAHIMVNIKGKNFDVVNWSFPDVKSYNEARQKISNLFKDRPGYRKF